MPVLDDVLEGFFDEEIFRMLMNVQEMVQDHPGKPFTEPDLLYLLTVTVPEDKYYNSHVQRMSDKKCQPIPRDKYNTMWGITGKFMFKQLTAPSILDQIFTREKV